MVSFKEIKEITPYVWEIPKSYRTDMRVPARVYATKKMIEEILDERSLEQLVNVATLPGIEKHALAMPDIHQGYGFPIGGVAAMRTEDGVISPGGVGYDINCGVRLLKTKLTTEDLGSETIEKLANQMQRDIPSGVGRGGKIKLSTKELDEVLNNGIDWAIKKNYATQEDKAVIEELGNFEPADASEVPEKSKKRGADQLGTLGAGNHFVEMQEIIEIRDEEIAKAFGLFIGQIVILVHTGSRGLGHQTCTEYVRLMDSAMQKYNITIPDRELASAPFQSPEGQRYFKAMAASANYAWVNRQLITHHIREAWKYVLKDHKQEHLELLYDVCHNVAKLETHNGKETIVHRKGATRSFGPNEKGTPEKYKNVGQPVIIPGSMGTFSFVLAGTKNAMKETFGSTCHGAGRQLSRAAAKRTLDYNKLMNDLKDYGVIIRAGSKRGLLEEAPEAYKDVGEVVDVVEQSGIAKIVAKQKPIAVIKG